MLEEERLGSVLDESPDDNCQQGRSQFGERAERSSDVKRVFKITLLVKEHNRVHAHHIFTGDYSVRPEAAKREASLSQQ